LSSKKINDNLWIKVDNVNITFEELKEDFDIYEDSVVTQVLHLEYYSENDRFFIKHMDHEYIFYSIEEYEKRVSDSNQKGQAKKRIKTFKIDDSKIPFDYFVDSEYLGEDCKTTYKQKVLFLHFVLECYFEHVDLLSEYFEDVYKESID